MLTLPNPLESAAWARPDTPAVVAPDGAATYAELRVAVARRAGAFARRGVAPGARVALLGAPSLDWAVTLHAVGWLGAVAAPLPVGAPRDELRARCESAQARWGWADEAHEPALRALDLELLPGDEGASPPSAHPWPLDAPRWCVHTSGTTGSARAVTLTAAQVLFGALGSAIRLGHHLDDRWLCCLPLHHVGGLSILARCAWLGTTVVLAPRFDASAVARALDGGEVSLVSLVPTMLERVLDARAERPFPPSLRAILLGGAAARPALLARCARLTAPVALTWGMTETASQVATGLPGELDPASGVGAPLPFARVEARAGGRLWVSGPLAAASSPGGAFETADRGAVDAQGRVHVLGRADDVLVSGGENVCPRRVEAALRAHPGVADALVVGLPDPTWGARIGAVLTPAGDGAPPSDAALRAWCRERLRAPEIPRVWRWTQMLPRTSLGKPSRAAARELLRRAGGPRGHGPHKESP